ncbi:MAG: sialidase family protein [Vicinamibacterales bacterium]
MENPNTHRTAVRRAWVAVVAAATLLGAGGFGMRAAVQNPSQSAGASGAAGHQMGDASGACDEPTLRCASSATPVFGADGTLWLVWAAGGKVSVARSSDRGRTFAAPVAVTPKALTLDGGADERPQILVDAQGQLTVAYAIFKDKRYNGQIFTAVSKDGGATFTTPRSITDDSSSQRFINLARDADGQVFASWIDKRHVVAEEKAGGQFDGASLAFAWSKDGGEHFEPARIAHDHMCECCRLGVALTGPHQPAVVFRNIFGGERDHALLQFNADMSVRSLARVAEDHWKLDACPHHGPSLALAPDGTFHAVWYSGGGVRQGSFYAHSTDGGKTFSSPMRIGDANRQPTRPYVYVRNGRVWLAWKEFDGEQTSVLVSSSSDGGRTWTLPRTIAQTADYSDHPLLVSDGRAVYLSWMTKVDGYRVLPVEAHS